MWGASWIVHFKVRGILLSWNFLSFQIVEGVVTSALKSVDHVRVFLVGFRQSLLAQEWGCVLWVDTWHVCWRSHKKYLHYSKWNVVSSTLSLWLRHELILIFLSGWSRSMGTSSTSTSSFQHSSRVTFGRIPSSRSWFFNCYREVATHFSSRSTWISDTWSTSSTVCFV